MRLDIIKYLFTIVFFVLSFLCSYSQNWLHYDTTNSSLNSNYITEITSDSSGNYWIATDAGIYKFNGVSWQHYNTSNSQLPHDVCLSIFCAGNVVWVGTVNGLAKIDGGQWTIYTVTNSNIPGYYITSVEFQKEKLWVGTWHDGCGYFDGINWYRFNTGNSSLLSNNIIEVKIDTLRNCVWISSTANEELLKYDYSGWTTYSNTNSGLPQCEITGITIDKNDQLVLASNRGVVLFDGINNWATFDSSNTPMTYDAILNKVAFDTFNNYWIPSNLMGLIKYSNPNWTFYDTSNTILLRNGINSVYIDQMNNKWIATYAGLYIFNDSGIVLNSSFNPIEGNTTLFAYPNPFIDNFRVKTFNNSQFYPDEYMIYNSYGQLIMKDKVVLKDNNIHFKLLNTPSGVYILKLISNSNDVITIKLFRN